MSLVRAKEIIDDCIFSQTHFFCHKASMEHEQDICCRGFFDKHGEQVDKIQIFKRLNLTSFIEQPDSERLPSYNDLNS